MTDGWRYFPLGEVAPAKSLPLPSGDSFVWNLSLEDIEATTGRILIRQSCRVADLGSAKCVFDQRHVLYSKLRPYLNKVVVPDAEGVGTSELIPLHPVSDRLDREFLAFYLRSKTFLDFANSNTRGANLPRISMSELWAHDVPVPPTLQEQRRIVSRIKECMQRVQEIEALHGDQFLATNSLMRSVRRELLGTPDSLPRGWGEVRLDELADVIYGISEAISANRDPSIGPPIVRMANISLDGHLDLSDLRYCAIPKSRQSHFALKRGDLLLNWRSGSASHVGKTAIFDEDGLFTCASFILRIRTLLGANNRYLRHVLNFMRAEGVFSGSSRMQINHKLNAAEFSAFPIRIPPNLVEQELIADQLDAAESLARQLDIQMRENFKETEQLRESILRKAFAGEL